MCIVMEWRVGKYAVRWRINSTPKFSCFCLSLNISFFWARSFSFESDIVVNRCVLFSPSAWFFFVDVTGREGILTIFFKVPRWSAFHVKYNKERYSLSSDFSDLPKQSLSLENYFRNNESFRHLLGFLRWGVSPSKCLSSSSVAL
jgi:hypothetical protein